MTIEEIVGKSVIGMLEIADENGEVKELIEIVGQIMGVEEDKGIIVCNHDTQKAIGLPVNLEAFRPAEKGYYTLHGGQKIKDPDLICEMRVINK